MNQETLEQAAVDYISEKAERAREYGLVYNAIKFGAQWHEQNSKIEEMYSEEDMLKCWNASNTLDSGINFKTFISQLKNKKSSKINPIFEQILKPYIK